MAEDRRAHDRLEKIEVAVKSHLEDHMRFEQTLQNIAGNTQELVELVRGVKGMRSFIVWIAPVVAAGFALWAWVKAH